MSSRAFRQLLLQKEHSKSATIPVSAKVGETDEENVRNNPIGRKRQTPMFLLLSEETDNPETSSTDFSSASSIGNLTHSANNKVKSTLVSSTNKKIPQKKPNANKTYHEDLIPLSDSSSSESESDLVSENLSLSQLLSIDPTTLDYSTEMGHLFGNSQTIQDAFGFNEDDDPFAGLNRFQQQHLLEQQSRGRRMPSRTARHASRKLPHSSFFHIPIYSYYPRTHHTGLTAELGPADGGGEVETAFDAGGVWVRLVESTEYASVRQQATVCFLFLSSSHCLIHDSPSLPTSQSRLLSTNTTFKLCLLFVNHIRTTSSFSTLSLSSSLSTTPRVMPPAVSTLPFW